MDRLFSTLGAVSGFLAVATGALAAHGLEGRFTLEALAWWETGAQYQMYHALALLAAAWAASRRPSGLATAAGWFFVAGIILFSGSLYALALTGVRSLGAITPIGGLAFLAGWALLALHAFKR